MQEHTAHTVTHITVDAAELRWQSEPGAWASVPRATANVGGPGGGLTLTSIFLWRGPVTL